MMSAQATHRVIALAAIAAIAACDDTQMPRSADAPSGEVEVTAAANPATAASLAQDVEAPEVFQVADEGLWDGRPSLGGLWVAHSDVTDPERVIIRNEENGRSITAALFRRERENPGPRFQVSSDAAEALGMLAGSPATLNVTALRRDEPAAEPASEEDGTALAGSEAPVADEAAAAGVAVAEADTAADDAAMAGTPEAPAAEAGRIAAAQAAAAVEEAPAKKGLFGFLRRKKADPAPAPAALEAADLAAAPLADGAADAADIASASAAAPGAIETATLSADGTATPVPAPAPAAPAAPEVADIPAAAAPPVIVEEPKRKRRGLFGFGRRDEEPLSALADQSASAAPVVDLPPAPTEAVADPGAPLDAVAAAPVVLAAAPVVADEAPRRRGLLGFGRREAEPLSALEPVEVAGLLPADAPAVDAAAVLPVAAEAAPEPRRRGLFGLGRRDAAPAGAVAPAAPAEVEVATLDADPAADFVQAGRFRSMEDAEGAAAGLRSGGVLPSLRRGGDGDWLLLVGPLPDPADRSAILEKVKALGFADAYLVAG
jgi:rare lipoprotein A